MREKGALKKILNKYKSQPQVCPDYSGQPLGFDNCFTAFSVLFFGIAFGFILMGVEWVSIVLGKTIPEYATIPDPDQELVKESILLQKQAKLIQKLRAENKAMEEKLMKYVGSKGSKKWTFHH